MSLRLLPLFDRFPGPTDQQPHRGKVHYRSFRSFFGIRYRWMLIHIAATGWLLSFALPIAHTMSSEKSRVKKTLKPVMIKNKPASIMLLKRSINTTRTPQTVSLSTGPSVCVCVHALGRRDRAPNLLINFELNSIPKVPNGTESSSERSSAVPFSGVINDRTSRLSSSLRTRFHLLSSALLSVGVCFLAPILTDKSLNQCNDFMLMLMRGTSNTGTGPGRKWTVWQTKGRGRRLCSENRQIVAVAFASSRLVWNLLRDHRAPGCPVQCWPERIGQSIEALWSDHIRSSATGKPGGSVVWCGNLWQKTFFSPVSWHINEWSSRALACWSQTCACWLFD